MKKIWNTVWFGNYKWGKRILFVGVLAGLFALLFILIVNAYIKGSVEEFIYPAGEDGEVPGADCILVLGAGITEDGKPSLILRDRLDRAVELYRQGVSDRLLMSGDHGREEHDEVHVMKEYAMQAGVPEEAIFMDHAGFSTYESMYRARDIFQVRSMVVVTQSYHIYRALYIARGLGIETYGAPSARTEYQGSWILDAREMLARGKEFFNMMIQPEPTYLGESIPISGNGVVTEDQ